jgi:hypothetical protein
MITGTSVAVGIDSSLCLAATTIRHSALIVNLSDSWIYLSLGGTAAVGSGIPLSPSTSTSTGGYCTIGDATDIPYSGTVNAISTGANKSVSIVEI